MKLISETPSKDGKNTVYTFQMNDQEAALILDLVKSAFINIPKMFELMQTRGRLKNLYKGFVATLHGKIRM